MAHAVQKAGTDETANATDMPHTVPEARKGTWKPAYGFHMEPAHRHTPDAVLVLIEFDGHLLWVRHRVRGWELPGGKVEPGETPEDAARREAYEEAGAVLGELAWVSEYAYDESGHACWKWVFCAPLLDVMRRPVAAETDDVRVMRPVPAPDWVQRRPDMSPLVKDMVYERLWRWWTSRAKG